MAAQKNNPNLSQAQYHVLAARVNEATGYAVLHALIEQRKPKETAAVVAARKVIADHEYRAKVVADKCKAELAKAKNLAMDAVLFQTADKAHAAVKTLEGKYCG